MFNRFAVITTSLCLFATPVLAEVPPIERLAPENSILIFGARNTRQAMDNIKKTGLWAMWESDRMKAMRADAMKEMQESIDKAMEDLGVDKDSLVCPTGPMGLAVFTVTDPDLGTPAVAMIAFADYGEEADKTDTLIKAALDKGAKEGQLEFEEKDIAGRNVYVVDLSKMQPREPIDEDGGDFDMMPMPDPAEMLEGMNIMHYVRDGSTLMLCSDLTALTDALDAIDGKGDAAGKFAARDDFEQTMAQVGEGDVYGALLTRDVMNLLGGAEGGQMMMMFRPTIRALTGEVAGYGMGVRFDTGSSMVEQSLGIYMPNGKKGLTALLDNPGPRGDIPSFVGADATSYTSLNFNFGGVMDVIKSVINSNPMLAAQGQDAVMQIEPMATPILDALGKRMVIAASDTSGVMAMECTDGQAFENAFAGLAAEGGFESRDFLGQRIYTMKDGMPMMMPGVGGGGEPMSLGIGGGYVFMGPTPGVEQALRSTGNADAPTLAKDDMYQRAVATLTKDPVVAWGYADTVATIQTSIKQQEEMLKQAAADAKEWDPEIAAEMEKELAETQKMFSGLDEAWLRQYMGPTAWQVRSTDKGFIMTSYLLPAKN